MKYFRVFLYIVLAFLNAFWLGVSASVAVLSGFFAADNVSNGWWLAAIHWVSFIGHFGFMLLVWGYRRTLSPLKMFALLASPFLFYAMWRAGYWVYNSYFLNCENCSVSLPIF